MDNVNVKGVDYQGWLCPSNLSRSVCTSTSVEVFHTVLLPAAVREYSPPMCK